MWAKLKNDGLKLNESGTPSTPVSAPNTGEGNTSSLSSPKSGQTLQTIPTTTSSVGIPVLQPTGASAASLALPLPNTVPSPSQARGPPSNAPFTSRQQAKDVPPTKWAIAIARFTEYFEKAHLPRLHRWALKISARLEYWHMLLLIFAAYNIFLVPFRLCLPSEVQFDPFTLQILDILSDILFMIEVPLNILVLFEDPAYKDVLKAHAKGWLILDILGAIPFSLINQSGSPLFTLNKMLRIVRVNFYWDRFEKTLLHVNPSLIRMVKLIAVIIYIAHVVACAFIAVAYLEPKDLRDIFVGLPMDISTIPLWDQYVYAYYWSFVTLTGYGGTTVATPRQAIFSAFCVWVGIAMFTGIIGAVAAIVSNLQSGDRLHKRKIESLNNFVAFRSVSNGLAERMRSYAKYLYKSGRGDDEVGSDLPFYLNKAVAIKQHKETVRNVPLFKEVEDHFLDRLAMALRSSFAMPREFIVRKGEIGMEMFFLVKGSVEVVGEDGTVYATLKEGSFFGEIALIFENTRRTANIRTVTHCDFLLLMKDAFDDICSDFPDQAEEVRAAAEKNRAMAAAKNKPEPTPPPPPILEVEHEEIIIEPAHGTLILKEVLTPLRSSRSRTSNDGPDPGRLTPTFPQHNSKADHDSSGIPMSLSSHSGGNELELSFGWRPTLGERYSARSRADSVGNRPDSKQSVDPALTCRSFGSREEETDAQQGS